jgi:hypothetical protein
MPIQRRFGDRLAITPTVANYFAERSFVQAMAGTRMSADEISIGVGLNPKD